MSFNALLLIVTSLLCSFNAQSGAGCDESLPQCPEGQIRMDAVVGKIFVGCNCGCLSDLYNPSSPLFCDAPYKVQFNIATKDGNCACSAPSSAPSPIPAPWTPSNSIEPFVAAGQFCRVVDEPLIHVQDVYDKDERQHFKFEVAEMDRLLGRDWVNGNLLVENRRTGKQEYVLIWRDGSFGRLIPFDSGESDPTIHSWTKGDVLIAKEARIDCAETYSAVNCRSTLVTVPDTSSPNLSGPMYSCSDHLPASETFACISETSTPTCTPPIESTESAITVLSTYRKEDDDRQCFVFEVAEVDRLLGSGWTNGNLIVVNERTRKEEIVRIWRGDSLSSGRKIPFDDADPLISDWRQGDRLLARKARMDCQNGFHCLPDPTAMVHGEYSCQKAPVGYMWTPDGFVLCNPKQSRRRLMKRLMP